VNHMRVRYTIISESNRICGHIYAKSAAEAQAYADEEAAKFAAEIGKPVRARAFLYGTVPEEFDLAMWDSLVEKFGTDLATRIAWVIHEVTGGEDEIE
jgi:hypothetical protein